MIVADSGGMKRICAYCQKEMAIVGTPDMSHGICLRHFVAMITPIASPEYVKQKIAKGIAENTFCDDLAIDDKTNL
jgi:hypothetical protein